LGQHLALVVKSPNNLIEVGLLCDIGETLAIMACALGKTSFAVTLLRIVVHKWMVVLLWFVIITMNIVNILAALFVFVQCKDPRHLWNPAIPSECWPSHVFTNFSLFVGGKSSQYTVYRLFLLVPRLMWYELFSIFWSAGFRSSLATLDDCLEFANEEEGKVRCGIRNEPWNLVSPLTREYLHYLIPNHPIVLAQHLLLRQPIWWPSQPKRTSLVSISSHFDV
jgi:hypothetical protein